MYQQIKIELDMSYSSKRVFFYYLAIFMIIVSICFFIKLFFELLDASIFYKYDWEEFSSSVTSFLFCILASMYEIKTYKIFLNRVEQFKTVLVINNMMIRSIYLNKLTNSDNFINWNDISKIIIIDEFTYVNKVYENHDRIYACHLDIYLKDNTNVSVPYRIADHEYRHGINCTNVTGKQLYKMMNQKFSTEMSENGVILEFMMRDKYKNKKYKK